MSEATEKLLSGSRAATGSAEEEIRALKVRVGELTHLLELTRHYRIGHAVPMEWFQKRDQAIGNPAVSAPNTELRHGAKGTTMESERKATEPLSKAAGSTMCDCVNWCDVNAQHRLLTGHHEHCPRSPRAIEKALDLIMLLAERMERWAADEDGIHPDAWEAYRRAKALEGVILPQREH